MSFGDVLTETNPEEKHEELVDQNVETLLQRLFLLRELFLLLLVNQRMQWITMMDSIQVS